MIASVFRYLIVILAAAIGGATAYWTAQGVMGFGAWLALAGSAPGTTVSEQYGLGAVAIFVPLLIVGYGGGVIAGAVAGSWLQAALVRDRRDDRAEWLSFAALRGGVAAAMVVGLSITWVALFESGPVPGEVAAFWVLGWLLVQAQIDWGYFRVLGQDRAMPDVSSVPPN